MEDDAEKQIVVEYRGGPTALSPQQLEREVERVWSDLLRSERGRARIGQVLGADPASLGDAAAAPFAVEQDVSGFDGVTLVVIVRWAALNVVVPVLVGLAKDEVKARLGQLWRQVIKPAIDDDGTGDKFGGEV